MKNLKSFGFNTKNNTYTIAEIGINHNGDFDLAKQLIPVSYTHLTLPTNREV